MSLFFHFANAETVSFEDLPVGKFFVYQNKIYLKTRNFLKIVLDDKYYQEPYNEADRYEYEHNEDFEKCGYNIFNTFSEELDYINKDEDVIPLNVEIDSTDSFDESMWGNQRFTLLKTGAFFLFQGNLYIKLVKDLTAPFNAFNFSLNKSEKFDSTDFVTWCWFPKFTIIN